MSPPIHHHHRYQPLPASNGHLPVVRTLLAITTANIAAKSNYAIRYAACNGHVDIVRLLYAHGADPFESDFAERGSRANRHHDVLCFLEEQRRVSGVVVEAI